MYAGAKKCIRQTLGWTAYVDDGWKDVDVTFTCAGGNPSEGYRILTTLTGAIVVIMVMTRAKGYQIFFYYQARQLQAQPWLRQPSKIKKKQKSFTNS